MEIIFLEPARQEMLEAAIFYEDQVQDLGNHFLDEIESVLQKIIDYPQLGKILDPSIRRALLTKFPFGLLYHLKEDKIIVVAVMHLRRKPNYWKNRTHL